MSKRKMAVKMMITSGIALTGTAAAFMPCSIQAAETEGEAEVLSGASSDLQEKTDAARAVFEEAAGKEKEAAAAKKEAGEALKAAEEAEDRAGEEHVRAARDLDEAGRLAREAVQAEKDRSLAEEKKAAADLSEKEEALDRALQEEKEAGEDLALREQALEEAGKALEDAAAGQTEGSPQERKEEADRAGEAAAKAGEELEEVLRSAVRYCHENGMEIAFTSPGWIPDEVFEELNIPAPSCGACLSNMAVTPGGNVVPCQSWLSEEPLGNMLSDSWESIWESMKSTERRNYSAEMTGECPLRRTC